MGLKKTYSIDNINGYILSHVSSKNGRYEYLYIMIGRKKVIKLSEFYHRNYNELKSAILNKNIKYLGYQQWNLVKETKEIFS